MGTFSVAVEIGATSGGGFAQVEALVDTGATYTVLSSDVLVRLNIQAIETVSFESADDRIVEYEVGEARVRLDGRERTTLVVFGPEATGPLLGATTLQLFNLAVDTTRERLVPVPALLKQLSQKVNHLAARLEQMEGLGAPR
jgi:clan AA aspartic protease|tara:strand:+ start:280 stop:705 length:426 start_codon:yes stop_codon:yes gene_type:complete